MDLQMERIAGWDLMRISLAIIVFCFHSNIHLSLTFGVFTDFVSVGAFCMTGFFVLSGTVLYYTHGNESVLKSGLLRFYWKRILGIMPLYWVVMILYFLDNGITTNDYRMLPIEILGLQSPFLGSFSLSHNGGTWFISCLLICYFVFPLVCELINEFKNWQIVIVICVLSAFDIYSQYITGHFAYGEMYSTPFLRVIQFTIGCLIGACVKRKIGFAIFQNNHAVTMAAVFSIFIAQIVILTSVVKTEMFFTVTYLQRMAMYDVTALPCAAIIIFLLGHVRMDYAKRMRVGWVLQGSSNISYSFFLAQFFVWERAKNIYEQYGINNNKSKIIIAFCLCLLISCLLHWIIEKPFGRIVKNTNNKNNC